MTEFDMDRRAFLKILAALPVVYTLGCDMTMIKAPATADVETSI